MISRRALIAAPLVFRPLSALASDVDVVIIGAGATGLAAAAILSAKGISYRVLEARNRIGGRVFTDTSLGSPVDLGAAYIHFAEKNPWLTLSEKAQIKTEHLSFNSSSVRQFIKGKELSKEEIEKAVFISKDVREDIDDYEALQDTSLAAIALKAQGEAGVESIRRTGHLALGEEPERVSVHDYNQLWGGENRVVFGGYGNLLSKTYVGLPVELNIQVSRIEEGRLVTLHTHKGMIKTKFVILTVPIGVLQEEQIKLPSSLGLNKALNGFAMGALSKIVFSLQENSLLEMAEQRVIDTDDKSIISFDIRPYHSNLVIASYGGDFARKVNAGHPDGIVSYFNERLIKLFGSQFKTLAHVSGNWSFDKFSRGSYAVIKPNYLKSRQLIREPLRENIFYAGEASAMEASMTVGGATLEGERIAKLIVSSLKP